MKYLILLGDGMADYPLAELDGKTPLEASRTPHMDTMAQQGTLGLIDTIPEGFQPGSDVANLSVLGYDPDRCYTGRGPLEAANMGVRLSSEDIAFRCNLVTLSSDAESSMEDYSAGHITTAEAEAIIRDLDKSIGSENFRFYPGVSYRHLMVWKNGPRGTMNTTPPHDIVGEKVAKYLPRGAGSEDIRRMMALSIEALRENRINRDRSERGQKPATAIWLWGQGRAPAMKPITEKYGITGGIISAVNLLNGIGHYAGLRIISVEGATGYIDTNYKGKALAALDALKDLDFVFVHVEAPDEMGHEGNLEGKIKAIERFDQDVVGTVLEALPSISPVRVMVLSDHPTPIRVRTHVPDPSPFAVLSSEKDENLSSASGYGETEARKSGILVSPGFRLIDHFIMSWRNYIAEKRQ
jgi:2,3-bisphosphoglycerate-independent phosphoglycerate mutase